MNLHQKQFLYLLLSGATALPALKGFSQQTANPQDNIPVTPAPVSPAGTYPLLYNMTYAMPLNYVRTIVPDQPVSSFTSNIKHRQVTDFFDGLGRPLQSVAKRAHADGNDVVSHHVYDAAGRESIQYLPFARLEHLSNGTFVHLPKATIEGFYLPAQGQEPYSKIEFDNSPLNRPVKQMAPGKSWVGSGRGVQTAYRTNNSPNYYSGDIWNPVPTIITIGAFPIYRYEGSILYQGNYGEGQLYLTTSTDEDGNLSEEVKDKLGRVICTRVLARKIVNSDQPTGAPGTMFPNNYDYTFYVYDKLNRLRAVIPPGAVASSYTKESSQSNIIPGFRKYHYSWTVPDADQQTGLCYFYHYDDRGRTIEKKIPGKGVEYFVYDNRDRPVLSQDGNLRQQGKWAFNFYDGQNRTTISGLISLTDSRASLQTQATDPNGFIPITSWRHFVLNYSTIASQTELYPATINDGQILAYNYYDNYSLVSGSFDAAKMPTPPAGDPSIVASSYSNATKGMLTGSKVKVLDPAAPNGNQWINTAFFYDAKGRVIQTVASNLKGGTDYNCQLYYFQGMPYESVGYHHNPVALPVPGATAALNYIKVDRTYRRNLGQGGNEQVWQVQQAINDGTPYNLAFYDYDHMGRSVVKQYAMVNVLQEYNIRGWLNQIHARNPYYQDSTYFKENLYYDDGFASKLYNGNIAGITWNNYGVIPTDDTKRNAYGYSYDPLGRLTHAEFRNNPTLSASWVKNNKDYTTSNISYDERGNIQTMKNRGTLSNPLDIDNLTYSYQKKTNQLIKVADPIPSLTTIDLPDFKDDANLQVEYTYDNNGNMITDANKKIISISYNHLNKPTVIQFAKGSITYVYDAMGNKLQKRIHRSSNQSTETWDYMGSMVYKDNILEYILNEEGRSRPEAITAGNQAGATKFVYDYFIKDHLGNVRTTLAAEPASHEYYAMHEIATANSEQLLFDNIATVRDDKPGSIHNDDTKAARLNAEDPDRKIGTAIMLRVMPGDEFTFAADAYYESDEAPQDYEHTGAEDIVSSLLATLSGGTVGGAPVGETENGAMINELFSRPETLTGIEDLINSAGQSSTAPRAGLNYLFFDEQMNLLSGSGRLTVDHLNTGVFENLSATRVSIEEPGFVIVYVDNQTIGKDVWFDNVQVLHYNTKVLEENHYYPFGLTVSTSAMGVTKQPLKYNGKELETNFDLQTYEYGARQYNSQIGRWNGIDPLAEKYTYETPYNYAGNNPIINIDVDGLYKYPANKSNEYKNEFPMLTAYLTNNISNDVAKSSRLTEAILRHADNSEFGKKELFGEILAWGKNSRTTITFSKELTGNANTVNSKNVAISWGYAKAIESILADPNSSKEDKEMAITAFFITMMDETTLVGSKYTKNPLMTEGGSEGDKGNDLTDEVFYSKEGYEAVNRPYQASEGDLKGTKQVLKTLKNEGKNDVIPNIPIKEN